MTAVHVLRHPETTWNVEQRYQGRLDPPLSERGKQQSARLVHAFAGLALDAVITGPLQRTRVLGEHIARVTGAPLTIDHRLIEIAQGPWEGMFLKDIREQHAALYARWYSQPHTVIFPGGEGLKDVEARAQAALGDLISRFPSGQVVVVTHSVVVQVLAACALSLDFRHIHSIRASNCGVTTLCGDEAPGSVLTLNSLEAIHGSFVASAREEKCTDLKLRKVTT